MLMMFGSCVIIILSPFIQVFFMEESSRNIAGKGHAYNRMLSVLVVLNSEILFPIAQLLAICQVM
jgi:hypothetical protein